MPTGEPSRLEEEQIKEEGRDLIDRIDRIDGEGKDVNGVNEANKVPRRKSVRPCGGE